MTSRVFVARRAVALSLLLALVQVASGQENSSKPDAEGQAGYGGPLVGWSQAERPWAEGEADIATAGKGSAGPIALSRLYSFSGVADDGEKGGAGRKEATSILCTNLAPVDTTIQVRIFQYSGALVDSRSVTAPANTTHTFSTQQTTIYFEDFVFDGEAGGTVAISQGHGQVWTSRADVICTAQVLDPLGYPPAFISALELFRR